MRILLRIAAHGALVFGIADAPAHADGWGGALGAASDYVLRGVSQTDRHASLQADVHYAAGSGLSAGLWAASVKQSADQSTTAELNGYLGYARTFSENWNAQLSAVHYAYPGYAPRRRYDYDELVASLSYGERATLTIAASPDSSVESSRGTVTSRPAYSYDLLLRQPLPRAFSAAAGIGYYDLERLVHTGYVYWNLGLGYDYRAFHFELDWLGSDRTARALFGDAASNRWVASLVWRY